MGKEKWYPDLIGRNVGFSPCFMTEKEYEEGYKGSIFYVNSKYKEEYLKHISAMSHIANMAKSYILKNWKLIKDWSDLELVITHTPTGKKDYYYKYKESEGFFKTGSKSLENIFKKSEKKRKKNQNPIVSIDSVVLDPTDGDFSVTINGNEYWWINDDEVIIIADYIENKLK